MSKKIYLLLFCALLFVLPASAQTDSASPLLDLLALVPDNAASREAIVSYADYQSIEAAREIETITEADILNGTGYAGHWFAAVFGGVFSGMDMSFLASGLEEMPDAVGFSFLEIDRSLTFGNPPGMGTILAGDFDAETIGAAFGAADFEVHDFDGVTVLCGAAGCEDGMTINLGNRNTANPFGGQFGRKEPLAILPGMLANSPDIGVVEAMLDALGGTQDSLADAPDYRAIALAAAGLGSVNQIQFVNPLELMALDPAALMLDEDGIDQLQALTSGFETLPLYTLAAFADVWDGTEQRALILLAYGEEANAQDAADELARRMDSFVPLSTGVPFSERLADISGVVDAPEVYTDADTGTAVAVWSMRYPMPTNEPEAGERLVASSMGFRFMIDALYRRDLYVLALEPGLVE